MSRGRVATGERRPRGVWIAAGVGLAVAVVSVLALFLPLVGLLGGATASSVGLVPFPVIDVGVVSLVCALLVAALLVAAATRRRTTPAWILASLAMAVSLVASVYPLYAVAAASADRAADVWPIVLDLWARWAGPST